MPPWNLHGWWLETFDFFVLKDKHLVSVSAMCRERGPRIAVYGKPTMTFFGTSLRAIFAGSGVPPSQRHAVQRNRKHVRDLVHEI
jgi:hypothetical protein